MKNKIAIVIPAHNEERRIGETLEKYLSFFRKLKTQGVDFEIIVVLNACSDNTKKVVESIGGKELIILEFKQGGKGFAVIEGFKNALKRNSSAIGFVDADAATSPAAFYHLFMHLKDNDGAIASRYVPGAIMRPRPTLQRWIVSRMYNSVIRAVFLMSYRDTQCGAKLFSRKSVAKLVNQIGMTKYAFDTELLYKARKEGLHIIEVPTIWADKEYSKVNAFTAGPMMLLGIIRLRILHSPLRRIIRVYDFGAEIIRRNIKKWGN